MAIFNSYVSLPEGTFCTTMTTWDNDPATKLIPNGPLLRQENALNGSSLFQQVNAIPGQKLTSFLDWFFLHLWGPFQRGVFQSYCGQIILVYVLCVFFPGVLWCLKKWWNGAKKICVFFLIKQICFLCVVGCGTRLLSRRVPWPPSKSSIAKQ